MDQDHNISKSQLMNYKNPTEAHMNKKQKKVLIAAFVIVILMGLFPPYSVQIPIYNSSNYTSEDLGYSFIFDTAPTSSLEVRGGFISGSIDFGKLFLQWLIVGIATSGLYFFMRDSAGRKKTEDFVSENVIQTEPQQASLKSPAANDPFKKDQNKLNNNENNILKEKTPSGIGGWLAFFIFGLMILGPLLCLASIGQSPLYVNSPLYDQFPNFRSVLEIGTIFTLFFGVLSFISGLKLLKKEPEAVFFVKSYLIAVTIYTFIDAAALIFTADFHIADTFISQMIGIVIGSVIGSFIWYTYLCKSKRVAATYGNKVDNISTGNECYISSKETSQYVGRGKH